MIDKVFLGGGWRDSYVFSENTAGTAIDSAEANGIGESIPDLYTLTVSARTGGTGTVTVATQSSNNPYSGRVKTGVNFDATTEYNNIVPGVTLIFKVAGANGNTSEVTVGQPFGAFNASGVDAGVPTDGVRHQVVNDGSSDVTEALVRLLTQAIQYPVTNKVFAFISPFADGATEKTAGGGSDRTMPYALTISGVSGSGMSKVATLNVDGSPFGADTLLNLTTGLTEDGTGIKAIGSSYPYQVVSGPLTGLKFALDAGVANSDKANVLIFPSRYAQIAPDVAGVEGTYGTADVTLTETGQATGVITASGVAYYWIRFLVPSAANNASNPYPCKVAISASVSSDAGWAE